MCNTSRHINICQKSIKPKFSCADNDVEFTCSYFAKIELVNFINAVTVT